MEKTEFNTEDFKGPHSPSSYFLSFEGIEACGKSTQITKISAYLEEKGLRVFTVREPGGTPFGEKLRQAILESTEKIHPLAEAHLFAASRAQLLEQTILKELSVPNTVVICDRHIDSSLAYQGQARKLGAGTILDIHRHFPLTTVPHKTFYLKIDLETSFQRQKQRGSEKDYFEAENKAFYQSLIDGYDLAAKIFPDRISIIEGKSSTDDIFSKIKELFDTLIESRYA